MRERESKQRMAAAAAFGYLVSKGARDPHAWGARHIAEQLAEAFGFDHETLPLSQTDRDAYEEGAY